MHSMKKTSCNFTLAVSIPEKLPLQFNKKPNIDIQKMLTDMFSEKPEKLIPMKVYRKKRQNFTLLVAMSGVKHADN